LTQVNPASGGSATCQNLPFGRRGKGFRYLELLSAIDDPGDGVGKLARIARTINEQARSYRGFDFSDEKDKNLLPAIARGIQHKRHAEPDAAQRVASLIFESGRSNAEKRQRAATAR
jgi:hypothetical protein